MTTSINLTCRDFGCLEAGMWHVQNRGCHHVQNRGCHHVDMVSGMVTTDTLITITLHYGLK